MIGFLRTTLAAVAVLVLSTGSASATVTFPGFNPDDGSELFLPNNTLVSVEFFDILDLIPPAGGLEFGFYFATDPNARITIFDTSDVPPTSVASINFTTGVVFDVDDSVLQDTFTAGIAPIGFYIESGPSVLYTQSSLNIGGLDSAETLPQIIDPFNYMIGFEIPDGSGGELLLALEFVGDLQPLPTPPQATPAPTSASLLLMGLMLVGGGVLRRRHS